MVANTAFLRSDRLESGSQPHPDKVRGANCAVSEHRWKRREPGLKQGPVDSRPVSQSDSAGFQRQSVGVLRPGGARHSLRSPAACEAQRGQRTSWNRRPTRNSRGLGRTVRPHNPREARYRSGAGGSLEATRLCCELWEPDLVSKTSSAGDISFWGKGAQQWGWGTTSQETSPGTLRGSGSPTRLPPQSLMGQLGCSPVSLPQTLPGDRPPGCWAGPPPMLLGS